MAKDGKVAAESTELVKFLKTLTLKFWGLCFSRKLMGFPKKTSKLSKIADGKIAVQCEGISKVSQNVRILGFGNIRENFGFSRKTEVY